MSNSWVRKLFDKGGKLLSSPKLILLELHDFLGGAVASWLVRSTPDRVVRLRVHCVVFLGKTLYSHGAFLHPGV